MSYAGDAGNPAGRGHVDDEQNVGLRASGSRPEAGSRKPAAGSSEPAAGSRKPAVGSRLLLPHEHGAYGQLLFPLATALGVGIPTWPAYGLTLVCILAFVGYEPLLVLLGRRGAQARRLDGRLARRQLTGIVALLGLVGIWSLWSVDATTRTALAIPLTLGCAQALLVGLRVERSVPGELVAAITLSSCAVPVALAGDASLRVALTCWLVFAASLTVATLAVRSVIGRVRGTDSPHLASAARLVAVAVVGTAAWLVLRGRLPLAALVALAPAVTVALGLTFVAPHPRHLRRIGWTLMASSFFCAIVLTLGLRGT